MTRRTAWAIREIISLRIGQIETLTPFARTAYIDSYSALLLRTFELDLEHLGWQKCIQTLKMTAENAFQKGDAMAMLTVRNLPAEVHRALRVRAAQHGQSTEAEVREILASAVKPATRVRLGDALAELGRTIGLKNKDFQIFERVKDKMPAEPITFK